MMEQLEDCYKGWTDSNGFQLSDAESLDFQKRCKIGHRITSQVELLPQHLKDRWYGSDIIGNDEEFFIEVNKYIEVPYPEIWNVQQSN